jgi:hypothetical protein
MRSPREISCGPTMVRERVPAPLILDRVCSFGITLAQLGAHRKRDRFKPIAAWLLTKLGGLTQREVATLLVRSGDRSRRVSPAQAFERKSTTKFDGGLG